MKQKNKEAGFLICKLGASLLGNTLTGQGINRTGDGIIRAGYESLKKTRIFYAASPFNSYRNTKVLSK